MVKCSCGDADCKIKVTISGVSDTVEVWFIDKNGKETLMYLDANGIVDLVYELRKALNSLAVRNIQG